MKQLNSIIKQYPVLQYFICMVMVGCTSIICYYNTATIGYKVVALMLLLLLSLLAILFQVLPILVAAIIAALVWNYFFIPPTFTLHISTLEDVLMFAMFFAIAMVNAFLTTKIKKTEKKLSNEKEKENTILLYNTLFNSLSHELKTPIATIIGCIDTIKEVPNLTSLQHTELQQQIEIASIRLQQQVDNLLNINRIESNQIALQLDWCDVNELIHNTINELTNNTHTILFETNIHTPLCKIDGGLIQQVLHNLLTNALLYTLNQSIISINNWVTNEMLCIEVSDNGSGIPNEL